MKKYIITLVVSVFISSIVFSQKADFVMAKKNFEESKTLESLHSNINLIEILDFQTPVSSNQKILSYTVYVNLFYETVDPTNASAVLDEVEINYNLNIEGYKNNSPTLSPIVQKTGILSVNGTKDIGTHVFHINSNEADGLNFTKIDNITLTASTSDLASIDIATRNRVTMQVLVDYSMYNTAPLPIQTKFHDWHTNHDLKEKEVAITWVDALEGAAGKYELEWVYMPANWSSWTQAELSNFQSYEVDWSKAVRIQTKRNYYLLNLIYEEGYLVSRVRTVRNQLNIDQEELVDKLAYGNWSIPSSQTSILKSSQDAQSVYEIIVPMGGTSSIDRMNWQYQAVFANDGLKQENVTYYDGSNNLKQSISISQTDEERDLTSDPLVKVNGIKMVAQESYTDNSGQPIVQILPSPLIGFSSIDYQTWINTVGNTKIVPEYFEDEMSSLFFPKALDISPFHAGAAQYYSPQNKNLITNQNESKFIPDANGFPYTRNEFLTDGSGRLRASYAPGDELKGEKEKNNQYFYAKPTQSELELLFGTNVGFAKFYKKNITVDGNGVTSVAYVDQKDRTVATSLVGEANSTSRMTQDYQTAIRLEDELLENGNVEYYEDERSFKLTYPFYVAENGDFIFNYELIKYNFINCGEVSGQACYECHYDHKFFILDENGDLVVEAQNGITNSNPAGCDNLEVKFSAIAYPNPVNVLTEEFDNSTKDIRVTLTARKTYTIIQELTLKTDLLDNYVETNWNDANCPKKTLEDFVQEELNESNFEDCTTEYNNDDPCKFVREAIYKDFRYPGGEFVKGAGLDDDVVDVILTRTRRLLNCDGTVTVSDPLIYPDAAGLLAEQNLRDGIKTLLRNSFQLTDDLTFRDFTEKYFDFFLEYHPSKCKLKACEVLNNDESLMFDKLLAKSSTAEDFELLLKNSSLIYNSDLDLEYALDGNLYNHGTDGAIRSDNGKKMDHYDYSFDPINLSGGYLQDTDLDTKNDLALFSLDKGINSFLHKSILIEYGVLEMQMFPPFRRFNFIDIGNDWSGQRNLWGTGNVEGRDDYLHVMIGYFANFNGGIDNMLFDSPPLYSNFDTYSIGITQIANLLYDEPGQTIAEKNALLDDKWQVYKTLYASAKKQLINDIINYSSCPPIPGVSAGPIFAVTDPNAGDDYVGDASTWNAWDKKYDWGEWWTNASTCDIYLGESPKDAKYSNVYDGNGKAHADGEASPAKVAQMIKKDLLALISSTTPSCYSNFIANTTTNDIDYLALLDNSTNAKSTFAIVQSKLGASCNAYDLNLMSIFAPYLRNTVDNNSTMSTNDDTQYFSRNLSTEITINCEMIIDEAGGVNYPTVSVIGAFPVLTSPADIDVNNLSQIRFKNYLNFVFGLNLSFEDYYTFYRDCKQDGNADIFGGTISWVGKFTPQEQEIKKAIIAPSLTSSNFYWRSYANDNIALITNLNNNLASIDQINDQADIIDFGTVGYGNYHQNLFFLKDKRLEFNILLENFNKVFLSIRGELNRTDATTSERVYPDFEDIKVANARYIENVNGTQIDLTKNGVTTTVKIERALLYSGGTILVRLLDLNDVFYDDFYFHYLPNQENTDGSELRLSHFTSATGIHTFNSMMPVFSDQNVRYVKLNAGNKTLIASTSEVLAVATNLGKVQLDNLSKRDVFPFDLTCEDFKYQAAKINGAIKYDEYFENENKTFRNNYLAFCTNRNDNRGFTQSLTMNYPNNERHFTLYYYDQADNLVATVPPAGISSDFEKITTLGIKSNLTDYNASKQLIKDYRNKSSNDMVVPKHTLQTTYKYNSDNQIIKQTTPNGGTNLFWYDLQGRLALSQNAEQRKANKFSYTLYDGQSRIDESGEVELPLSTISVNRASEDGLWRDINYIYIYGYIFEQPNINEHPLNSNPYNINDYILNLGQRNDVVKTYYDREQLGSSAPLDFTQENLRSRVATQAFYKDLNATSDLTKWQYATHYSYDPVGNVKTVLNDYYQNGRLSSEGNRFKRTDYAYDPVSGNVLMVYYQLGKDDAFYHKYEYDAENRISNVETSRDGIIWDKDAEYKYYMHGPLARVEIGNQKVQGIDYAYTLQGWLKAVNSGISGQDIGGDDDPDDIYGEDAFGFSLQYYNGDYDPIGANSEFLANHPSSLANLYNGNIAAKTMHNKSTTIGKSYTYDQLNRLKKMEEHHIDIYNVNGLLWSSLKLDGYEALYDYDPNGNILGIDRLYNTSDYENGLLAKTKLDDMSYTYYPGTDKLEFVSDENVTIEEGASEIAVNTPNFEGQESGNYTYDGIGNLIKDEKNNIDNIEWYPNGKIKRVTKNNSIAADPNLFFEYDALGNRVKKEISFVENGKFFTRSTYYSRDAQGNIMATYDEKDSRYNNGNAVDGDYYFQYSHDYAYYSQKAAELLPNNEDDLIDFLATHNYSRSGVNAIGGIVPGGLNDKAYANLTSIENVRSSILPFIVVSDYLNEYGDATQRILLNKTNHFANYIHDNHFVDFLSITNDLNQAYISALKVNSHVDDFYENYNTHFQNSYNFSNVSKMFNMSKLVLNNAYNNNTNLFKGLLELNNAQYSEVSSAYLDPNNGYFVLKDNLQGIAESLMANDESFEEKLKLVNGILMMINIPESKMEVLFDGFEAQPFTEAQYWMGDEALLNKLHSMLYHINHNYQIHGLEPPFEAASLPEYNPMAVMDWTQDGNGVYLDYFLLKDFAEPSLITIAEAYFTNYAMTNKAIYFTNGTEPRAFTVTRLLENSGLPIIRTVVEHASNVEISKIALHETEDVDHLASYLNNYYPKEVLRLNYNSDYLQFALSCLPNYNPFEYAKELRIYFGNLNQTNYPVPDDQGVSSVIELIPESFDIYGSSRLGVMDASISRKDGPNKFSRKLKAKTYELTDHLGNVVATVSDKKIHPQELVTNGNQNINQNIGFQADVTSRYDRFPFGMEILERSGDFKKLNSIDDSYETVYNGLLKNSGDYTVSNGASALIETDFNVYNQEYATLVSAEQTQSASFTITAKLKLNEVIPNFSTSDVYRIEVMLTGTTQRVVSSAIGTANGYVMSPSLGDDAPSASLRQADDKRISYELTGEQINNLKSLGKLNLQMNVGSAPNGVMFSFTINVESIIITKLNKNLSIPLAQRNKAAYRYGFQGQEVDNEWNGVAFGGGSLPVWEDEITDVAVFEEQFMDPSLNQWIVGTSSTNVACASNSNEKLNINTNSLGCGATTETIFVEQGKQYKLHIDKVVNLAGAQGTLSINWEYYDAATNTWNMIASKSFFNNNGLAEKMTETTTALSNEMRIYIYAGVGNVVATVDDITIMEELGDWQPQGNQADNITPAVVRENGRFRLQTNQQWSGLRSDNIAIVEKGEIHRLYFDAEVVYSGEHNVFISVDESADGVSGWDGIGNKNMSATAINQQYFIDFTPTKDFVRIYSSTFSDGNNNITEIYYDNFRIVNKTDDISGGGTNGKVAFKYRIYDAEIGRFLSRDNYSSLYPNLNPYHFTANNPISFSDHNGDILKDAKGNIIITFSKTMPIIETFELNGETLRNVDIAVYIYANDGTKHKAWLTYIEKVDGTEVAENNIILTYDCHGLTKASRRLIINSPDMEALLKADGGGEIGEKPFNSSMPGDIILYRDNSGSIIHSSIYNGLENGAHKTDTKNGVNDIRRPNVNVGSVQSFYQGETGSSISLSSVSPVSDIILKGLNGSGSSRGVSNYSSYDVRKALDSHQRSNSVPTLQEELGGGDKLILGSESN